MKPKMSARLNLKVIDDEVLVHDLAGERVHVLNAPAVQLLQLCTGEREVEEIAGMFSDGKDVAAERVLADVRQLIAQYQKLGLVTTDDP